jgi:hypothetical protein
MTNLIDRAVHRFAGLWWTAIYSGLCVQSKSRGTRFLPAFERSVTAEPTQNIIAA